MNAGSAPRIQFTGPLVVERISTGHVLLRTTQKVPDEEVCRTSDHIDRVARSTTITYRLEKLLHALGSSLKPPPDHMAAQHAS